MIFGIKKDKIKMGRGGALLHKEGERYCFTNIVLKKKKFVWFCSTNIQVLLAQTQPFNYVKSLNTT